GVYYAASSFEGALAETMHHHARFMAATAEPPGWTSDFRELIGKVEAEFHDLRASRAWAACLTPNDYSVSQALGGELRAGGSNGLVYPSVRQPGAECLGAFYPDVIGVPAQGRHLSYHWDGERIDKLKDVTSGVAYRVEASSPAPNDVAGQH
ncbi:MAG: RES domain-containing protein, partial [Gammaproteobacteria bacterium]